MNKIAFRRLASFAPLRNRKKKPINLTEIENFAALTYPRYSIVHFVSETYSIDDLAIAGGGQKIHRISHVASVFVYVQSRNIVVNEWIHI